MKKMTHKHINCQDCASQADCCRFGAWVDLDDAKKILTLGLKGEFFQLEKDKDFPSGYCIGTSYEDEPCTFLDKDGLCLIHKADYNLKPKSCIEFPFENSELSPYADVLCTVHKKNIRKKQKKSSASQGDGRRR